MSSHSFKDGTKCERCGVTLLEGFTSKPDCVAYEVEPLTLAPPVAAASITARPGDLVQPCGCMLVRREKPTGEAVVSLIACSVTCEVAAATLDYARHLGKGLTFDPLEQEQLGADWKGLGL